MVRVSLVSTRQDSPPAVVPQLLLWRGAGFRLKSRSFHNPTLAPRPPMVQRTIHGTPQFGARVGDPKARSCQTGRGLLSVVWQFRRSQNFSRIHECRNFAYRIAEPCSRAHIRIPNKFARGAPCANGVVLGASQSWSGAFLWVMLGFDYKVSLDSLF